MTDAERIFVDTNVLLSATDQARETHREALEFLKKGLSGECRLFASGQIFREYLVVATRPISLNGLGLTPAVACSNLRQFQRIVQMLEETQQTSRRLIELTEKYNRQGKQLHDTNVVATMETHGLSHLKTWNPKDYEVFDRLTLL
jgi:predicted nucleic acid-binding protein